MKRPLFFLLLSIGIHVHAQNLVPNPSFEDYKKLNCELLNYILPFTNVDPQKAFDSLLYFWTQPTKVTCELLSNFTNPNCSRFGPNCSCTSNPLSFKVQPKDGYNYTAITMLVLYKNNGNGRGYIQTPLMSNLKQGFKYLAGCYYAYPSGDSFGGEFISNNLGLAFTSNPIGSNNHEMLDYQPQVNQNEVDAEYGIWKKLSGCFTATGDEQYLTLGSFFDDAHSKVIERTYPYDQGSDFAETLVDSVFTEEIKEPFIPNVITPNGDLANEKFTIKDIHFGWWALDVYNRWGTKVFHSDDYRNSWSGDNLSSGVYFYELQHRCPGISHKGSLTIVR